MFKRSSLFITILLLLSVTGCVKETYNMKMLSKQTRLSPTLAISAVKGDISFSDMVKSNDTVTFDMNKLVVLVFRRDSIINLTMNDFSMGTGFQQTAIIEPGTFDLNLHDIMSHITGNFLVSNPSIIFSYTNSFSDSLKVNFNMTGKKKDSSLDLNLVPFNLKLPNLPVQQEVTGSYIIDKSNSNLPLLISLPPEFVDYSGTVIMTTSPKSGQSSNYALAPNHLTGSLEIDVPLELRINNLQFTDTVDNFMKDNSNGKDNPVKPENFQLLRLKTSAINGFPLGVSLKMSLYDSSTNSIKSTVEAKDILEPAAVDSNGKATNPTETSTSIEMTNTFFSNVNKADKIIFSFTLNSTGDGSQDVKIYSDYRINFNASVVFEPEINLN